MSETTTAPKNVTDVLSPETIAKIETYAPFWEMYKTVASEANDLGTRHREASKSESGAIDGVLKESTDEKVVAWREFDAKISEKISELRAKQDEAKASATEHAKSLLPPAEDTDSLKTEFLAKRKAANLTGKNILALLGDDEDLFNKGVEHYGIVEVIGLSTSAQSKGATGIVRKRIASATVDGETVADSNGKVSFTTLSQRLKVNGDDIRTAAAAAANVESVRDIPAGAEVSFTVNSGDKSHNVTVTFPADDEKSE